MRVQEGVEEPGLSVPEQKELGAGVEPVGQSSQEVLVPAESTFQEAEGASEAEQVVPRETVWMRLAAEEEVQGVRAAH